MIAFILFLILAFAALSLALHVTVFIVKLALWLLVIAFAISAVVAALIRLTSRS